MAVERIAYKSVSNAQHLRHKPSHRAHQQSARQRLQPAPYPAVAQKPRPHSQQQPRKIADTTPPATPSTAYTANSSELTR